ncbi:MAG: DUF4007 family protein [Chloroflexota bacterium]|nr:DUF4007 family protein [Chloroflexota bacterium]
MRFSGHESFVCRYAWLPKAYRAVVEDPSAFANVEKAMVTLGVGKNMVRSIRFWVEVMGAVASRSDRTLEPTHFGEAVFGEGGFDPFLEDARTLWLLHWNLSSQAENPLFAWNFLLYKWPYAELTRSEALAAFMRETGSLDRPHSSVTLAQHLDVFLRTYVAPESWTGNKEESLDCPLAELELLQNVGDRRVDGSGRREPVYAFRREPKPEVTTGIFEYCLYDCWNRHHGPEGTITYRDVAISPGSIGQAFKLPEDEIRERLDVYAERDTFRPFNYRPSAVQGLLSRRDVGDWDPLAAVYEEDCDV